jgi:hypothetical protein
MLEKKSAVLSSKKYLENESSMGVYSALECQRFGICLRPSQKAKKKAKTCFWAQSISSLSILFSLQSPYTNSKKQKRRSKEVKK